MRTSISRVSTLTLLISALWCAPAECGIFTLEPGMSQQAFDSGFPIGGTTLASLTSSFNTGRLEGTLTTQVISGDESNPYAGGLTFTYLLSISSSSVDSVSELRMSSFAGFQTDVSYTTNGDPVFRTPSTFSRSSSGDVIHSLWSTEPVGASHEGALIVVQTDAGSYQDSLAGIIDGLTVNVGSFAPIAVPEPGVAGLLLVGFGGILAFRRRAIARRARVG